MAFFNLIRLKPSHFLSRIVGWISAAHPPFAATMVDALRLSTLPMSNAEGLSNLFGSGLARANGMQMACIGLANADSQTTLR